LAANHPRDEARAWYKCDHQGKEVVHACMIDTGLWRCAAARPHPG
jgi:hypothetical protein